jgi:mono/diheme cytochrome c family protein
VSRAAWLAVVTFACSSSDPPASSHKAAPTPPIPQPSPQELVTLSCGACHGIDLLGQQRITAKQWDATVKKMAGWGALVDDTQQPALAAYLAAQYPGSAAPYAPPAVTGDALAAVEPTDDGVFGNGVASRGREVYAQGCLACHAADGHGGPIGTNLVDRYLLFRAADFAAIVRAGRGRMPPQPLGEPQIADLLAFLRTLGNG